MSAVAPLRAQIFFEGGAGWTYVPDAAAQTGSHFRMAVGSELSSRVALRIEGSVIAYDVKQPIFVDPSSCSTTGCDSNAGTRSYASSVAGISATGLVNLAPGGRVYLVGGAGLFFTEEVRRASSRASLIGGLGFSLPITSGLRAFSEARVIGPFSNRGIAPQWVVPITVGIRASMASRNQH